MNKSWQIQTAEIDFDCIHRQDTFGRKYLQCTKSLKCLGVLLFYSVKINLSICEDYIYSRGFLKKFFFSRPSSSIVLFVDLIFEGLIY